MTDLRPPLVHYQPLRLVYQVWIIGSAVIRAPLWAATYLAPSRRQRREWTTQQAFLVRLLRTVTAMLGQIGITDTLSLAPGKEGRRFQILEPFPAENYKGPMVSDAVKPTTMGGTWYPEAPASSAGIEGKLVLLHLHGGGFVFGDGRPGQSGPLSEKFLAKAGVDLVFVPQYRLSAYGKRNPFPAALQDALTSYLYLVRTLKIPSRNIILSGDSAGANLAIAFLRYFAEDNTQLPLPRCAVLISPWVAPLQSLAPDYLHHTNSNFHTDHCVLPFLRWGAQVYADGVPNASSNPYITPLGHAFRAPIPIWVNIGAAEFLAADALKWTQGMIAIPENEVRVNLEAAAPHDTLLCGHFISFGKSARKVAAKAGRFIQDV
ncbi:alpha/beta hydrolase fold-3 domain-containing protein [Thozetella sp. PMI_491]|nr:alpha/beta hydrolase fold-3 domain-containing protein [Thozetella sp. PMI_491]